MIFRLGFAANKDADTWIEPGHDEVDSARFHGLEALDSTRFAKKSQERTQFHFTRRPREGGDPFDAAGIIHVRRSSERTNRLDSRRSLCPRRRVRE